MHVVLVHWTAPPTVGGVETHLVDLAGGLSALGHEVTLITGEYAVTSSLFPGVQIEYEPLLCREPVSPPDTSADLGRFAGKLKALNADIIHAHNMLNFGDGWAVEVLERTAKQLSIGLLNTWHSLPVERSSLGASWEHNACSKYMADAIHELTNYAVSVNRLPVDTRRFDNAVGRSMRATRGTPLRIFQPGRLVPEKGGVLSIEVLGRLALEGFDVQLMFSAPDRTFEFGGEVGSFRADIESIALRRGLLDRVRFRSIPLMEMSGAYRWADVILAPSIYEEPYGLVALEAMACSRPVVASATGGLLENVENNVTGVLCKPGDVDELATATIRLAGSASSRTRMGKAGRDFVIRNRNLAKFCLSITDEIYDRLPS